jgi:hypothetical protein
MKKGEMKSTNEFRMFHKFLNKHENNGRTRPLYSNFQSVSGCMILAEVWNQEIAKIWNHELAKLWNHGPAKLCIWIPEIRES